MRSIITWFVDNPVASNLLMFLFIVGGFGTLRFAINLEEFPNIDPDVVRIQVPYLGAAPQEVESGVCRRIEEALEGEQGIDKMRSVSTEGMCTVNLELDTDFDTTLTANNVKAKVDGINTLPAETEKPIVSKFVVRGRVMSLAVSGRVGEQALKELGEELRSEIVALPGISQVDLTYVRPYEISIEVSENELRRHSLTLAQVADAIRRSSIDLPGGALRTSGGEILLRTNGQAYTGAEFANIVVLTRNDGTQVFLDELATIVDGFEDGDLRAEFDGEPSVMITVYRIGQEDIIAMADTLTDYVASRRSTLPAGTALEIWTDESQELRARLDALVRNAIGGLFLVMTALTIFLRFQVAMWVAAGIPVALLGTVLMFPLFDFTISTLTVMAFILVLGIVVDDAIVVGERVFAYEQTGLSKRDAAIRGTYEVSVPVIFGVLTTMATFLPLVLGGGRMGSFFSVIGYVVMIALVLSIIESQLILPAHLSHRKTEGYLGEGTAPVRAWIRIQGRIAGWLEDFATYTYGPALQAAIRNRYFTVSLGVGVVIVVIGLVASGRVVFQFFPPVEGDRAIATLTLPEGVNPEQTLAAAQRLVDAAEQLRGEMDAGRPLGSGSLIEHVLLSVGQELPRNGPQMQMVSGKSNFAEVALALRSGDERGPRWTTGRVTERWRELTGSITDAVELTYSAAAFTTGEAINLQLEGRDVDELRQIAATLRGELSRFEGVFDITDSFRAGKQEIQLELKPGARALGITLTDLGRQVRQAFYGEEVQRVQRGREDVRVMVRYPEADRRSLGTLENMRIRTADGTEVPFSAVARFHLGRGYSSINRVDGRRVVNVIADVDRDKTTPERVIGALEQNVYPALLADHPNVRIAIAGEQEERLESLVSLAQGAALAMLIIYILLAIPLKSYTQPFVIMSVIPFGAIGAITGHYIMGESLVFFSMLGIVALSGVVVNASLVLVDFCNRRRREGVPVEEALLEAGTTRFRPIILTSLTTFIGLVPLMVTANWATAFVIPMAISLAWGVLFATGITLFLVPALYRISEDIFGATSEGTRAGGTPADDVIEPLADAHPWQV